MPRKKKRKRRKAKPKPKPPVSPPTPPTRRATLLEGVRGHPWLTVSLSAAILLSATYWVCLSSPTLIAHEKSILRLPVLSHAGNIAHIISRDFLLFTSGQFRPFSYIALAVARTFVAPDKLLFWHIWLLAFHLVNTLLVFAIARHFTRRLAVAMAAAAVFGLHPLCTVIVNDINQFHMLLGLTLSLGAFKAYLSSSRNRSKTLYSAAVALFLLAALTARPAHCLGLILLAYELLYRRSGFKRAVLRLWPFALVPLLLLPLWLWFTPHPIHYKYVGVHKGSFLHGLFSVTGATRQYAGGLVLTRRIPTVLHETVEKIFRWNDGKFLLWAGFNLVLLVGAAAALAKKQWAGLGILLIFIAMIPYASVAYNRVVDYVSWSYLYFPVAGVALFIGGLYELLLRVRRRWLKVGVQAALLASVLFLGARSVRLNLYSRSPLAYWSHISRLNEESQTAVYEMGKAYLAQGQLPQALHYFFAPMVHDLKYPCLAMGRYYCRRGNQLAAAIHLRFGVAEKTTGVILEDYCETVGELLLGTGALDHAEENFGKILMVDPFNATAMTRLAQVWFLKGFVGEADRMLRRARSLAPHDRNIANAEKEFRQKERAWQNNPQQLVVTPPKPDWLRYVLTQVRPSRLRREIVALSDIADPNDAVIQLEAMICLLEDKKYDAVVKEVVSSTGKTRAQMVLYALSGDAYACAAACRAFAFAGDVEHAVQLGQRALFLDSQSKLAWGSLALALALQDKPDATAQEFMKAVAKSPAAATTFYYNFGMQKKRIGKKKEAVELFEKALKAQPSNVRAQQALGETLLYLGQFEQAIKALQKALAMNPADAQTHDSLGWALLKLGKNDEAVEALKTAIELDPKSAMYHDDLAACLAKLKRNAEAIQEFRRAIELDSSLWDAHYNLGNLFASTGNLSEAAREFREVIKIKPTRPYVHFSLGAVLYQLGKYDEAVNEYREEIQRNPNFADVYTALVNLHCERREYSLAWNVVKRANHFGIKLDPRTLATLRRVSPDGEE